MKRRLAQGEVDDNLKQLEEKIGALPPTVEVITPGGGRHLYFEYVEGTTNSGVALPGNVDIRSEGGFVLAPPSVHPNGGIYRWSVDSAKAKAKLPNPRRQGGEERGQTARALARPLIQRNRPEQAQQLLGQHLRKVAVARR
jgi:hypothetical protein